MHIQTLFTAHSVHFFHNSITTLLAATESYFHSLSSYCPLTVTAEKQQQDNDKFAENQFLAVYGAQTLTTQEVSAAQLQLL